MVGLLGSFYKGIIIGLMVAVPMGPIGLLCVNRTLDKGYVPGLVTGLGSAVAHSVYAMITVFGLTIISNTMLSHKVAIKMVGSIFLIYLGIKIAASKISALDSNIARKNNIIAYFLNIFFNIG